MLYVKLIAKPNTWFKAGTEVWSEDRDYKRITKEEFIQSIASPSLICCRGIRVCEDSPNENGMGYKSGEEREDGECCNLREFIFEFTDKEQIYS